MSSFIGREGEVAEIAAALAAARLVTLTGAGGVGKTRLAIRVGEQLGRDDPGGLAFVELAALSAPARAPTDDGQADPARVAAAAASVLGLSEQPGRAITDTLRDFLRPRRLLLILDNCEHLIPECAALAATLLEECPALRLLATSRQSLGITGEVLWRVPPLSVPAAERGGCRVWGVGESQHAPDTLTRFESVRLFVERGRAVNREFALTAENTAAVAAICRRLDGLPLAIELAAARLRVLSAEQIAARLSDRFALLTGGSRAALPRHQTLRATLEWSHDLLAEEERALFRRLAVFPGSFTLEAACAVGCDDVLDLLSGLVDKSLVAAEQGRYRLLETLREFARSQGSEEEREAVGRRHALYFLRVAEPAARPTAETERLDRLEREHDHLRAAVDWAVSQREVEIAVRLGAALGGFWNARGYWREGRERLAAILALDVAGDLPSRVLVERAHALDRAGDLARLQNDDGLARELYEQALTIYRQIGDQHGIAWAGISLGDLARRREEFELARALITEALTFFQGLGDLPGILRALEHLGELSEDEGDRPVARQIYRQCLTMARELGDHGGIDYMLHSLGRLAYLDGDWATAKARFTESLATARLSASRQGAAFAFYMLGSLARLEQDAAAAAAYYHECLALYRELEDAPSIAGSLAALAFTLLLQGDQDQAPALFKEALRINRKLENRRQTAHCLEGLAAVAAGCRVWGVGCRAPTSDPTSYTLHPTPSLLTAARLYGAAAALREGDAPRWPADQADYERNLAALRARLAAEALAAAWAEGAALPLEEAVTLALSVG